MFGVGGGKSKSRSKKKSMSKWQSNLGKGIAGNFQEKFKDPNAMFDYMNKPGGPYGQMWGGEQAQAGTPMAAWQKGQASVMAGGPDITGRSQAFQDRMMGSFNNQMGYDPQQQAAWDRLNSAAGGGAGGSGGGPPLDAKGYGEYYNAIMSQMRPQSQLALQDAQAAASEQMGASGHSFSTDLMASNQRMNNQFEADLMRSAVDPSVALYNNERNNYWNNQQNAISSLGSALQGTYASQYGGRNNLMDVMGRANSDELGGLTNAYGIQAGALSDYGRLAQDAWQSEMENRNRNLWSLMGLGTGSETSKDSSWNANVGWGK